MSNLAKYEKWSPDDIEEERQALDEESDFLKLPQGRSILRFLPPRVGTRSPFVKAFQHYIDIPGLKGAANFNCPRLMAKRFCPACDRVDELRATGNPADYELAGEIRAGKRVYANVIDRGNPERGPVVFGFGKMIHEKLISLAHNPDWGDYTDPGSDGYDIAITRKGEGMKTKYEVQGARTQTPLSADAAQAQDWLSIMRDLSQFSRVPSDEELERMLPGWKAQPTAALGSARGRRAADEVDAEFVDA